MTSPLVAKVLWTLCYASPEEIPKLQHPRCATGNRRNLQCGDDFIMRAKATRDTGSPCLGAVGTSVWGSALLVVSFSVLASILLCSLSMSGVALSTRRYVSGDPVHDLASARGHEWLATCVPAQDVLSQGILCSSTTCGILGCSEEALRVTASWW